MDGRRRCFFVITQLIDLGQQHFQARSELLHFPQHRHRHKKAGRSWESNPQPPRKGFIKGFVFNGNVLSSVLLSNSTVKLTSYSEPEILLRS